jgi:hypothetical protein
MTEPQDERAKQQASADAAEYLNTLHRQRNEGGETDPAYHAQHWKRFKSDPAYHAAIQQHSFNLDWLVCRLNREGTYKSRASEVTDPLDDFNIVATQWDVSHWSRLKIILRDVDPQDHKLIDETFGAYARAWGLLDEDFLARREERRIGAQSDNWSAFDGEPQPQRASFGQRVAAAFRSAFHL